MWKREKNWPPHRRRWSNALLGLKYFIEKYEMRTSGVNFINMPHKSFTHADPESVKFQLSHQYHFTLLGSMEVKDSHKTLMKLTPNVIIFLEVRYSIFKKKYFLFGFLMDKCILLYKTALYKILSKCDCFASFNFISFIE